jgi:hypothetical protein
VMPKGQLLPIPLLCTVTFGTTLPRIDGEDKAAFLERARSAMLALRPDTQDDEPSTDRPSSDPAEST